MIAGPRLLSLLMVLACACVQKEDEPTATQAASTGSTAAASSTGATTGATGATGTTTTSTTTSGQGTGDGCESHAIGGWNACDVGGGVDNSLCGWMEGAGVGTVSCLHPSSGGFNVCGIEGCEDECDCFAPPETGDAVVICAAILGGGGKACALYCAGGQTCPDGMACQSGYCYWPG